MWSRYSHALKTYPVRTNVITAGIVGFTGDLLAQRLEDYANGIEVSEQLSLGRSLKVASWNAMVSGPLAGWLKFLDAKWPLPPGPVAADAMAAVAKKVALNQVTAAPLNNGGFFSWVIGWRYMLNEQGPAAHGLWTDIYTKLANDMPRTTANSCLVWGTAWTINMVFLPPHTKVLFNSVGQVFWTAYLSLTGHRKDV